MGGGRRLVPWLYKVDDAPRMERADGHCPMALHTSTACGTTESVDAIRHRSWSWMKKNDSVGAVNGSWRDSVADVETVTDCGPPRPRRNAPVGPP